MAYTYQEAIEWYLYLLSLQCNKVHVNVHFLVLGNEKWLLMRKIKLYGYLYTYDIGKNKV